MHELQTLSGVSLSTHVGLGRRLSLSETDFELRSWQLKSVLRCKKVILEIDSWVSLPGHHIPMPWLWKQHLLLATHCISHVERFPWNTFWEIHSELNHLSRMESSFESILRSPCTPNGSLRWWSLHRHHVFFVEWGWDTLNIPLVVSTHSLKPLQQLHHQ